MKLPEIFKLPRTLARSVGLRKTDYWRVRDALFKRHEGRRNLARLRRENWTTPTDLVVDTPYRGRTLNALAHPRFWQDAHWLELLGQIDPGNLQLHRKAFEYAQTAIGLEALDVLRPQASVLVVGAGHDLLMYWLTNRVAKVVATDLYQAEDARWSGHEGDPSMLRDPSRFARIPYRQEALEVLAMDGRKLTFGNETFDAAYSLSSIEHFGGPADIRQTMQELHRVLRPGGIAAIATELVLNGRLRPETFTWPELERDVLRSTPLRLVQPIDFDVSLNDYLDPVRLDRGEQRLPHLIVRDGHTVFTSILLFFRKP